MLEPYQIVVPCKSLEVHNLAESALSVGRVSEGVEALLQGQNLASTLFDGFPDDAVRLREKRRNLRMRNTTYVDHAGIEVVVSVAVDFDVTYPFSKFLTNLEPPKNMPIDFFTHEASSIARYGTARVLEFRS